MVKQDINPEIRNMVILTSVFVSSLITAQIVAGIKIANIFGFIVPAGF